MRMRSVMVNEARRPCFKAGLLQSLGKLTGKIVSDETMINNHLQESGKKNRRRVGVSRTHRRQMWTGTSHLFSVIIFEKYDFLIY